MNAALVLKDIVSRSTLPIGTSAAIGIPSLVTMTGSFSMFAVYSAREPVASDFSRIFIALSPRLRYERSYLV